MKRLFLIFAFLFLSTAAFADTAILQSADGNAISASNPLQVTAIGSGEDPSVIFNVKTEYGAKGDGIHLMDGNITSGTATFTSATAIFTSNDVGKVISIVGAGGATIDLSTTISAFTDSHTVTLAANASATVTNVSFVYGTDDTTNIQAAIDAVAALPNPFGEVFFPSGIYIVNGAFSGANNPSQLRVPTITRSGAAKPGATLVMSGPTTATYQGAGDIYGDGGAVIYSTKVGTSGTQSILSGYSTNAADPGNCTQIKLVLNNLTFRTVQNPVNSGLILSNVQNVYIDGLLIDTAGISNDLMPQPTTSSSFGLKMPRDQNGIGAVAKDVKVRGFYNGILLDEHGYIQNGIIFYAVRGLYLDGLNVGHSKFVNHLTIERTKTPLYFLTGGSNYVHITALEIEHNCQGASLWSCTTTDIDDAGNTGYGIIQYSIVNIDGSDTLVVSGGTNLSYYGMGMTGASDFESFGNGNNVGLGTAGVAPSAKFHVQSSDATTWTSTATSTSVVGIGNTNTTNNNFSLVGFLLTNSTPAITSAVRIGAVYTDHTASSEDGDFFVNTKLNGTYRSSLYIQSDGDVGIGNSAPAGRFVVSPPTAEAVTAGMTITANACGTIKQINSTGNQTTSLTDTFTAPAAANTGCCMDVINIDTADTITLDFNTKFLSAGGADVALGPNDTVRVCSNGTSWFQIGATGNN